MPLSDIPTKRIETHSITCAQAVVQVLNETFFAKKAADKAVAAILKANHQFGSRDRRIINETLYSVLRWWGWLKHLVPNRFMDELAAKADEAPSTSIEEWYAVLCLAWLLEGRTELPPSAIWWLHHSGARINDLPELPQNAPILERRKYMRHFFSKDSNLPPMTLEDLIPSWTLDLIDAPVFREELIEWQQRRPPVWLRAQINDVDRVAGELKKEDVKATPHSKMRHALKAYFSGVNLRQLPSFLNGHFEIQDLASQTVSLICAPSAGQRWWDACAGAGGKTLHLAFLMQGKGHITASDNRIFKLEELKLRARRCGFSNIITKEWLGVDVQRYHGLFNGVLVDVPCSCSGVWRRSPWLKWTLSPDDLPQITTLQKRLLENASKGVANGGTLVYATCSMFRQENQDVISDFLERNPDFALEPFISPINAQPCDGQLQIWPWDGDCDAMFIAKLTKKQK